MKGFKPVLVLGLVFVFCVLVGCSRTTPQNGAAPLDFRVTKLPAGAVPEPYKQVIVVSGGVEPYTYSITSGGLPPGITLDTSGIVSGTPTVAGSFQFTVKVVDSQTPVQAYNSETITLVINPVLSIPPTTLSSAVIGVAYTSMVAASGGTTPYVYTVIADPDCLFTNTTTCASNRGLTLSTDQTDTNATISGTPTGPPGTFNFTVQAADAGSAVATANLTLTIIGKLQGNYAFSFNGYNNAQPFYMVGSFVADGNGNITSGIFDRNGSDSIGAMTAVPITPGTGANGQCPLPSGATGSVYCVGRSGVTDGGNLGTIVIVSSLGTYSFSAAVSLISDSRIILADQDPNNPDMWGSGVLKTQVNLSGTTLDNSSFAFGSSGVDSGGNRYAAAGYITTDANGNVTSGQADTNDNGTLQTMVSVTGSVSSVDPSTGRATATFTIGGSVLDYALYAVPPTAGQVGNTVLAVQTDPISSSTPVTMASFLPRGSAGTCRNGTFSNQCLSTNYPNDPSPPATNSAVFELNAISNAAPDVSLGPGQFDGQGGIQSYALDENNGGTVTSPSQYPYVNGRYNVDATSGRVTVSLNGATYQPVWYLVGFNAGFVVGTDPSVTAGSFDPQTSQPPYFNQVLFGQFYGGSTTPLLSSVTNEVDASFSTPPPPPGGLTGTFTSTYDTSGPPPPPQLNQTFSGTYCLVDQTDPGNCVASNSTSRITILNSNNTPVEVLYVISAGAAGATNSGTKTVSLSVNTPGGTTGTTEPNPVLIVRTH